MENRLLGLDALRGLAAIVVVIFHLGLPIHGAHLAVDFFFMLSGFVMARTYEERLRNHSLGPITFLAKRYRRLWGWMALGTAIGFVALLLQHGFSSDLLIAFGLMVLMVPALNLPTAPYLLNVPLWSIVYELVANAAHGLGLARLGKLGLALFAGACAIGLAWAIHTAGFPRGGFPEYHWLTLFRVGVAYVLGILIWRLFGDRAPIKVPFAAAFAALPVYVGVVYVWPLDFAPLFFILVLAPLMMFGGMAARFDDPDRARSAAVLGAWSFPLYAVHFPALMLLRQQWGWLILALIGAGIWAWYKRDTLAVFWSNANGREGSVST